MHRDVTHRGKIPLRGADPAIFHHRLARLQSDLHNAVRAEQFEGAAQTRDAIEELKAKLLVTGSPASDTPAPSLRPPGQ
jgi:protein arginine kinase activator